MMMTEPTSQKLKFFPGQIKLGRSHITNPQARFIMAIAGTGWGKTWFFARLLLALIQRQDGGEYLVMSPTHAMLATTTVPKLQAALLQVGWKYEWKSSAGCFVIDDGWAIIWCVSGETPERAEGIHADGAWLDEGGQLQTALGWETLQRRTDMKAAPVYVSTTPYSDAPSDWLTQSYNRWQAGDELYYIVQGESIDNPYYSRAAWDRAKRELAPWRFDMLHRGKLGVSRPGLVYPDAPSAFVDWRQVPDGWQGWDCYGMLDWGTTNPTAYCLMAEDPKDGAWYQVGEHYLSDGLNTQHAAEIKRLETDKRVIWRTADPSAKGFMLEMRQHGLYFESADNDVQDGIDAVTARLRTDRLKIVREACPNTVREAALFRHKLRQGTADQYEQEVVKRDDHTWDAIRYGVMKRDRQPVPRVRWV